jgi:lysosomal-associated membrane protein 1/2
VPLDCDYQPNDIVPIAVGVALAALVVLVLVAYLYGRRKSRQRGYQSV